MKHIDTVSEEEKKARKEFADPEPSGQVTANKDIEATVRTLLALRHKMDEDALEASRLKAKIMSFMGHSEKLAAEDGSVLASWTAGNVKETVDYKGLLAKFNISDKDIEKFTTTKQSSRIFSIELD